MKGRRSGGPVPCLASRAREALAQVWVRRAFCGRQASVHGQRRTTPCDSEPPPPGNRDRPVVSDPRAGGYRPRRLGGRLDWRGLRVVAFGAGPSLTICSMSACGILDSARDTQIIAHGALGERVAPCGSFRIDGSQVLTLRHHPRYRLDAYALAPSRAGRGPPGPEAGPPTLICDSNALRRL